MDAVVRLVRLLEAPVLMPLIEREITYRLMLGGGLDLKPSSWNRPLEG